MPITSSKQLSSAKLWIVLVGVNHYQDSLISNLKYCANDCKELAEALTVAAKQFKETEITAIYDSGIKPNLEEVINSIKKFRLAQPEDTILFYFSGHGELDLDNRPVLGVTDTKVIKNESDNSLSFDPETGLKLDRLLEEFRNSPAQSQLIWLDACQAKAEINSEPNNANGQIIAALNQESQQTRPGKNFFAMLSCDQTERSWEFAELGHGLFTYSLIKGLQGNAADAEGKIGVNSLFDYVKNNIAEYLELKKHPITTEATNTSAKGLVVKPTKQVKRFPIDVYQNPRKIDSSGEVDLIIGSVAPASSRKALICDRLSSSLIDIQFCKLLQDRGGFKVEYCFLEPKAKKNISETITGYLQDRDNETVLLYLAGEIEQKGSKYDLSINEESRINFNWLGEQLRSSPVREVIIIVDVFNRRDRITEIREILNPDANKSLCLIAASSTAPNRKLIHQVLEILTTAADLPKQLWAASLITQLQKRADFTAELTLQKLGLYGSANAINILLPKSRRSHNQTFELDLNPYKSLQAFTQDDTYFFHGREILVTEIIDKLESTSFLAVVGASGSGKSSVVRAGVIPKLISEGLFNPELEETRSCQTYIMRPGNNPLTALASALAPENPEFSEGVLYVGIDSLVAWLRQQPQEVSILVIDQFEELFTTKKDTESLDFINFIVGAVKQAEDCFKVIFTLRDDFLKDCLANNNLAPLISQSNVLVRPSLMEDEYRQILEQPAQKVGLTIEDGLVNVLLQELQTESLPLLQFALDELWRKRTPGELTLANYQENIGGLGAILGKKAESTYQGLTKEQQECAQTIFQSLVQLGEGKEDTRRRVAIAKLEITKYQDVFNSTLKALIDARLLVIGLNENNAVTPDRTSTLEKISKEKSDRHTTVEIAHEILIRNWDTLRWWLDTNRNQIRLTRELEQKADEWANTSEDQKDNFLLSQASLIKYQELYINSADKLTVEVNQFVGLSQKKCDRLKQEEEKRRNRELAQERKARINAQRFSWTLGIGLIVSFVLTGLVGWQWQKSRVNETTALLNSSEALLSSNRELDSLVAGLEIGKIVKYGFDQNIKMRFFGNLHNAFNEVREFNRLEGHTDDVNSVAFSPNGQTITSASGDGTIKLWNLQGKLVNNLEGSDSSISRVVFSPNGQTITSASGDGKLQIWNLQNQQSNIFQAHEAIINDLKLSPDGQIIASASDDQTVKLWNLQGQLLHTLKGHTWDVTNIAFSPDEQTIASASSDKTVKLWNLQGQLLDTLEGHTWEVTNVAFSPDGKTVASASWDKTVRLWNLQGQLLHTLKGHTDIVEKVIFSPDGETIASASNDKTVKLWNLRGQLLGTIDGHNWDDIKISVSNIAFSPDGETIASAINDKTVKLWDLQGQLLHTLEGHSWYIYDIAFSPDGQTVATASGDDTLKLWNLTQDLPKNLQGHDFSILDVTISPDGETVASASRDKTVKLWSAEGELLHTLKGHSNDVTNVQFAPNGQTVASASYDGTIKLWNTKGQLFHSLEGHTDIVEKVIFSPDGKTIASASNDKTVKLWNLQGQLLHTLQGHADEINSVVFSPDGKIIASASNDKTVKLWNLQGKLLHTLEGQANERSSVVFSTVAFSPDGKTIAAVSNDKTVKLWNLQGQLLHILEGHTDEINSVVFSPDGKIIASASNDRTVKLWNLKGQLLHNLEGHTLFVKNVEFILDGKIIASSGGDDTVNLWNLEGQLLSTLKGHNSDISSLAFNSNSLTLASASENGIVKLWSFDIDEVMTRGCNWARDYLTNNPNVSEEDRKICDGISSK